ncbi:hypothetical protein [Streptomyces sp. NPDC005408]
MYEDQQERERPARDVVSLAPTPRLAGVEEDEPAEPHIVRGID